MSAHDHEEIIENQQQSTQEKDLTNSEKCQRDPDLRKKFEEHMCDQLSKDKDGNITKIITFDMDENSGIEKRAITRKQIAYLIDILSNKKNKVRNYRNYAKGYEVKKTGETYELFDRKRKEGEGGKIIALEDMWDRLWEIHRDVGFNGRTAMNDRAKTFYDNMTRPILEVFLKYSEEFNLPVNELDKINSARDLFNLYGEYFLISLSLFSS